MSSCQSKVKTHHSLQQLGGKPQQRQTMLVTQQESIKNQSQVCCRDTRGKTLGRRQRILCSVCLNGQFKKPLQKMDRVLIYINSDVSHHFDERNLPSTSPRRTELHKCQCVILDGAVMSPFTNTRQISLRGPVAATPLRRPKA